MRRVEAAGGDLRQKRLEDEVVFLRQQLDMNIGPPAEQSGQIFCRVDSGKAATEDDDAMPCLGHPLHQVRRTRAGDGDADGARGHRPIIGACSFRGNKGVPNPPRDGRAFP
jgi:hypothetical protein